MSGYTRIEFDGQSWLEIVEANETYRHVLLGDQEVLRPDSTRELACNLKVHDLYLLGSQVFLVEGLHPQSIPIKEPLTKRAPVGLSKTYVTRYLPDQPNEWEFLELGNDSNYQELVIREALNLEGDKEVDLLHVISKLIQPSVWQRLIEWPQCLPNSINP